jgi:hypothetical protein
VPRDTADARWLFDVACQRGCAIGCNNAIVLYESGQHPTSSP